VDVEGDRPVSIAGDPTHPVSKGFICKRGLAAIDYFEHPGRLDHPLKRVGARGAGQWEPIAWDDAIREIAERLTGIRQQHGAEAVAYLAGTFHGPDHGVGIRFMNLFGSPNYGGIGVICAGPKVVGETLTYGFGPAAPDIRAGETRCIMVWGHHPAASSPPHWSRVVEAKRAGARLIVIDPVRTEEARAADLWLQIRPGSDPALALGLLHVMIEEKLYDAEFVAKWTLGFDDLARRVAGYAPDRVAALTWLSPEQIIACARAYASERPAAISHGSPNGMGQNALNWERSKAILVALAGNLDRRGGNRLYGPPSRVRTKVDLELYATLPVEQRIKRLGGERFRLHVQGYERIAEAGRRLWPEHEHVVGATYGAAAHPPSIFRAILDQQPYAVRGLILQYNNAIGCYANATLVREALRSPTLDLLVAHELFMTPTALYADYVLPAASWLEKSYMYVSGWNSLVLGTARAVTPRHERHGDYELFRDLGRAVGQGEHWPASLEEVWDGMLRPADLTFRELCHGARNWITDPETPQRHETRDPRTGGGLGFATPTGKVELTSTTLAACGYDSLPDFREPCEPAGDDAAYPYVLMTGSTHINMTHQDHRQIERLRRHHPDPVVRMHPQTGASLGLTDGDWAWIETPRGRIRQRVKITDRIHPMTVDAERWWYPEWPSADPALFGVLATNVNVLTDDALERCDPAYGAWAFRMGRCRISPAQPPMPATG
jgi:anaerobic selenocysteine-containing dehydrogenase